jgi:hypothetical protein
LPGSLLVYPLYSSSAISRHTQNTRISLTNTHETQSVTAHLYFVDGDSGAIDHGFVLLGRQQTISILASDLDPATTGYLLALAVDDATGRPRPFNHLIGDSHVKLASGMAANLIAEAFQMNAPAVSGAANAPLAELRLDGEQYSAAPRTLSLASLSGPADGVETLLILNRLGGNAATALGAGLGTLYDGRGGAYGFSFTHAQPQLRALLTPAFVATTPALDAALPAGRTGWLKFQLREDAGILGAAIRLDRRTGLRSQGRGLTHAALSSNATLTLPIFPPA